MTTKTKKAKAKTKAKAAGKAARVRATKAAVKRTPKGEAGVNGAGKTTVVRGPRLVTAEVVAEYKANGKDIDATAAQFGVVSSSITWHLGLGGVEPFATQKANIIKSYRASLKGGGKTKVASAKAK
jgi:hypothetical protein